MSAAGGAAATTSEATVTQYLLSMPHDSAEEPTMASMDPAELEATLAVAGAFLEELAASGALVFAGGLHPPSTAVTVDHTGDDLALANGPYTQAPEYTSGACGWSRQRTGRLPSPGPRRHPRRSEPGSRSAPSRTSRPESRPAKSIGQPLGG